MICRNCGAQLPDNSKFCRNCGQMQQPTPQSQPQQPNEYHQLPVGTLLRGRYQVGRALGQGGFGITYLGYDTLMESHVAIKEFYPNSIVSRDCTQTLYVRCHTQRHEAHFQASKERFLREAKALVRFKNIPEVVDILDFVEENNTAYIIMEYVQGMSLAKYVEVRGGRLSAEETFRLLRGVMDALAAVHRGGIVHRDIAPDNIILHPTGGAKLLDFGAVRAVESTDADASLAKSTEAILKHGFAPIEQYNSRGGLGPWTDLYAMCATIYYCLTGTIPPEASLRISEGVDPDWSGIPGLTARQRDALGKGMAIRARDRFATMDEFLEALFAPEPAPVQPPQPVIPEVPRPQAPEPVKPKPVPPVKPSEPGTTRKPKKGIVLLAVILVLAVIGIGAGFALNPSAAPSAGRPGSDATLEQVLGDQTWDIAYIYHYDGTYTIRSTGTYNPELAADVWDSICQLELTRTGGDEDLYTEIRENPNDSVFFSTEEGFVIIYVTEDGRVAISPETEEPVFFEDGQQVYTALHEFLIKGVGIKLGNCLPTQRCTGMYLEFIAPDNTIHDSVNIDNAGDLDRILKMLRDTTLKYGGGCCYEFDGYKLSVGMTFADGSTYSFYMYEDGNGDFYQGDWSFGVYDANKLYLALWEELVNIKY